MLQELTFVDNVLPITVFDLPAVRGKFSCKNIPTKFSINLPRAARAYMGVYYTTEGD